MEPNRQYPDSCSSFDRQVGALLDFTQGDGSIIDRLMAMPLPAGESEEAPKWDAAVARRLERRLAAKMREMIEAEPERRRA